jgi:hypothetical protein
MALNTGDADCNDGMWGVVWDRNTGETIASLETYGSQETTIHGFPGEFTYLCEFQPIWRHPFSCRKSSPIPWLTIYYANNTKLEKSIGLAIQLSYVYIEKNALKEEKWVCATHLFRRGLEIEVISHSTGLSVKELQKLWQRLHSIE